MNGFKNRSGQRGLSLIFALLALVALTLGAVALLRSVDTGVLTLGNMSQKQSALVAAGRGTEDAIQWLQNMQAGNVSAASTNDPTNGYYASAMPELDPTGRGATSAQAGNLVRVDWDGDGECKIDGIDYPLSNCITASAVREYGGMKVRYVINRMCPEALPESPASNPCARPITVGQLYAETKTNRGTAGEEDPEVNGNTSPYFRITTRAQGVRGTVTFTETLVNF